MTSELEEMGKELAWINFWGMKSEELQSKNRQTDRDMLTNKERCLKLRRRRRKIYWEKWIEVMGNDRNSVKPECWGLLKMLKV